MTLFKNYLDKLLQANTDADAAQNGASVAGGSVTKLGFSAALVNDSAWVDIDFTGATVVGTDLAIHAEGAGLDVLTDGLYAITVAGYLSWGGTTPNGVGFRIHTADPSAGRLRYETYPPVSSFLVSPVVPLSAGDLLSIAGYVDGGDAVDPSLTVTNFVAVKIGPVPA